MDFTEPSVRRIGIVAMSFRYTLNGRREDFIIVNIGKPVGGRGFFAR
jgi:hypothetical protein